MSQNPPPLPAPVRPVDAWKLLLEPQADLTPFRAFDRAQVNYSIRSGDWKPAGLHLDEGVLAQGDFQIPYSVRGSYGRVRPRRETVLGMNLPGGPGTAQSTQWRSNFSPEQYRVATASWRGVGDTAPFGSLVNNDTARLLEDIDALRRTASAGRDEPMVIHGGSWGMTMAAMYAAARPENVAGLVLRLPFLASREDVVHNYGAEGALARRYPEAYAQFRAGTGKDDPAEALAQLAAEMGHADARRVKAAFVSATQWEYARNGETYAGTPATLDLARPETRQAVARARILAHYSAHDFFMPEEGAAAAFRKIPRGMPIIVLAHRADPLATPQTLARVVQGLPQAEIHVYDANWHWVARENEDPARGFDNSFVNQGCPFALGRMGLALEGRLALSPGVQHHARPEMA